LRVLFVTSRFPYPPWRGNQVRTAEWLAALHDSQRVVVCPRPEEHDAVGDREKREPGVRFITFGSSGRLTGLVGALAGGGPLQEGLYATASARRALLNGLEIARPDVAIVQMVRCGWAQDVLRSVARDLPIVFDAIDAMGLHFARSSRFVPAAARPLYAFEAKRCRRREVALAAAADVTTAVAERDLEALSPKLGAVIPVAGREVETAGTGDGPPTVLLSGNLGYRPTVQGALWFARHVWPRVRQGVPEARWVLAGARPTRAIKELDERPGVEVHGDVPDLAPFLDDATVAIAPMAEGSGVPMKVLEAWAADLPVVAHPWTVEGLLPGARDGVMVAEEAAQWGDALTELLTDHRLARHHAEKGRAAWSAWYHPGRVAELVRDVVKQAAGGREG
jgi:glycosyltransferase involved in cell wall biosynthesis